MIVLWIVLGIALCAFFVFAYVKWRDYTQRKRRRHKREGRQAEKTQVAKVQATKIIVFSIMLTYYIAFAVGVWVVVAKDVYQLSTLLAFVGSVAVFAVAFYCWKSKAENLEKIKKGNPELTGTLSDFSGMASQ